jgi:hypothetical protein
MSNHTNRFVDRDMLMRYHLGLGVGHTYAPFQSPNQPTTGGQSGKDEDSGMVINCTEISDDGSDESGASDGTTDEDGDEDEDEDDHSDHSEGSDDELATLDEMYGHWA